MDILRSLSTLGDSINLPNPQFWLAPISIALALQIMRAADGHGVIKQKQMKECLVVDKQKFKTTGMLASLLFVVTSSYIASNTFSGRAMIGTEVLNILHIK